MNASLISMIIAIVFVVLLAAGFLVGLWRGLRKSLISLVMSIIGVLIAFFLTPVVSGTVLSINIDLNGEIVALNDIALHLAKENPDMALLIESNDGLKAFLSAVPSAVANALLFILATVLIEILFYFVYLIFSKFVFKKKVLEKKHRLAGAGIGFAKMFLITVLAFMPFAGLVGTVSYIVGEPSSAKAQQVKVDDSRLLENEIPKEVKEVVSGFENNLLVKICGVFGMDNAMFDYYGSITVNGDQIKVREEVINAYDTADAIYQISKIASGKGSTTIINFEKVVGSIAKTVNGNLFKQVISPIIGDIIVNSDEYDFTHGIQQAQPEAMDHLRKGIEAEIKSGGSYHSYFASDLNKLFEIFRSFVESGMMENIAQQNEIFDVLQEEGNMIIVKENVQKLFDIKVVRAFAKTAVEALVYSMPIDQECDIVSTLQWSDTDWKNVSDSMANVVENLVGLAAEIDFENEGIIKSLFSSSSQTNIDKVAAELGSLIEELRTNKLLQTTNGESIVDCVLTSEQVGISLPTTTLIQKVDGNMKEIEIENYADLIDFVLPSIREIKDNNLGAFITGEANSSLIETIAKGLINNNENLLKNVLLPLVQIERIEPIIVNVLSGTQMLDFSSVSTYQQWDRELGYVSQMLASLYETEISGSTGNALQFILNDQFASLIDNLDGDDLDSIFKPMLWAQTAEPLKIKIVSIMKQEIETIINAGHNTITMSASGICFEEGASEDQTIEFIEVVKDLLLIAKSYNPLTGIQGIDGELLGGMLEKMKANAYRTENGKTEEGIFGGNNGAFNRICDYAKIQYQSDLDLIPVVLNYAEYLNLSEEDKTAFQSYYDDMQSENYKNIDFVKMLADFVRMTEIKNQLPSGI